jgi:hypothetical protein
LEHSEHSINVSWGGGKGGEMTQTLYAHMNKRKKMLAVGVILFLLLVFYYSSIHTYALNFARFSFLTQSLVFAFSKSEF